MFSKKDVLFFITSLVLISVGYALMAFDPEANGFGIATLWIAPPLLLIGFMLPVVGIVGLNTVRHYFSFSELTGNPWKHVAGLSAFVISFCTYLLTLEPTASLWDCSEFIASAYKLEVPHTPGTPLSLLIGRIFTILSFGDVARVAWSINVMSAFFSALTVYLVYYIIYYFGDKLPIRSGKNATVLLIAASLCGSLCLTFSDTFWFSAVEAETYGAACFFLVLIVWLILKGKSLAEPLRSRHLILIFYISGLSYCIHPMCLLSLATLTFAWHFGTYGLTFKNIIFSIAAGLAIVLCINRFVAVGLFELAFSFDLFFVNNMHLPFYSGVFILIILLTFLFVLLLKRYSRFAAYTWSVIFLLLSFSPYLMLFIRSNHNPPIDETNPENLSMIKAYMNRESYPSSPLLYGPYFDAQIDEVTVKKTIYFKGKTRYEVSGTLPDYHYENSRSTILPRLYSNDLDHIKSYGLWTGLKQNEKPRFGDNLKFMFGYQLGHMYFRYLLWNFAGRKSDRQNSSWLNPWDNQHSLGSFSNKNKARNQYWMIPLVLGIVGILYQYKKGRKDFLLISIFFLVTGIVLALYLNSTPNEPRERDYIYVGSYMAFCIWIGLGILAIYNFFSNVKQVHFIIGIISLGLPSWMLYQNYDDHNRSNRTFQVDYARSVLNSCAPNAILFTGGDNDTFPLWYLQEVEEYRTDVRVMVLSYLNTDWYINQLRKPYYQSKPFALTLNQKNYRQYGPNDVLYVQEKIKEGIDIKKFLQLLKEEHAGLTVYSNTGDSYNIVPSKTLKLQVDKEHILTENRSRVSTAQIDNTPEITLKLNGSYLQKNALAFIDVLASNDWKRPIYFNYTSLNTVGLDLNSYVIQEGNIYRMSPIENKEGYISVDTELSYRNLIEKADYTNLLDEEINFNYEDYHARMITPVRESFNALAVAFLREGNSTMATNVLVQAVEHLYPQHLRPSYTNLQAAEILLSLDKKDLAKSLCTSLFDFHYNQLQEDSKNEKEINRMDLYLVEQSAEILQRMGEKKYLSKIDDLGFGVKSASQQ